MMPDDDQQKVFDDFATVVADGAYVHMHEGFVSLLFYQDRTIPIEDKNGKVSLPTRKETIADIRLSINALKQLMQDVDRGLKLYPAVGLFMKNINFVIDSVDEESVDKKLHRSTLSDEDVERLRSNVILVSNDELSDEGKEEYAKWVVKIVLDHFDELREIIRKDKEKQEAKKLESKNNERKSD
jgi:hypothetical protein